MNRKGGDSPTESPLHCLSIKADPDEVLMSICQTFSTMHNYPIVIRSTKLMAICVEYIDKDRLN